MQTFWAVLLKVTFDSGTKFSTCSLVPGTLHMAQVIKPQNPGNPDVTSQTGCSEISSSDLRHKPFPVNNLHGRNGPNILVIKFQPLLLQTVGINTRSAPRKGSAGTVATLQAPTRRGQMFDSGEESQPSALQPKPVRPNYMEWHHLAVLLTKQQGPLVVPWQILLN